MYKNSTSDIGLNIQQVFDAIRSTHKTVLNSPALMCFCIENPWLIDGYSALSGVSEQQVVATGVSFAAVQAVLAPAFIGMIATGLHLPLGTSPLYKVAHFTISVLENYVARPASDFLTQQTAGWLGETTLMASGIAEHVAPYLFEHKHDDYTSIIIKALATQTKDFPSSCWGRETAFTHKALYVASPELFLQAGDTAKFQVKALLEIDARDADVSSLSKIIQDLDQFTKTNFDDDMTNDKFYIKLHKEWLPRINTKKPDGEYQYGSKVHVSFRDLNADNANDILAFVKAGCNDTDQTTTSFSGYMSYLAAASQLLFFSKKSMDYIIYNYVRPRWSPKWYTLSFNGLTRMAYKKFDYYIVRRAFNDGKNCAPLADIFDQVQAVTNEHKLEFLAIQKFLRLVDITDDELTEWEFAGEIDGSDSKFICTNPDVHDVAKEFDLDDINNVWICEKGYGQNIREQQTNLEIRVSNNDFIPVVKNQHLFTCEDVEEIPNAKIIIRHGDIYYPDIDKMKSFWIRGP